MKMILKSCFLLLFSPLLFLSQDNKPLIKDLDGDTKMDKVYYTPETGIVTYELSSQEFKKVSSDSFEDSGEIFIAPTKSGFEVRFNNMRSGFAYQFRYEKETQKMRLIGMSRYEFGPANNDGSGESSVNLLTNEYVGEWNYYDLNKNELIRIPTIKKKMVFPKTYFDNLDGIFSKYSNLCSNYYEKSKKSSEKK